MNSLCVYDYRLPHATPAGGPTTWALGSGVLKGGGSAPGDSQRGGAMRLKGKKKVFCQWSTLEHSNILYTRTLHIHVNTVCVCGCVFTYMYTYLDVSPIINKP